MVGCTCLRNHCCIYSVVTFQLHCRHRFRVAIWSAIWNLRRCNPHMSWRIFMLALNLLPFYDSSSKFRSLVLAHHDWAMSFRAWSAICQLPDNKNQSSLVSGWAENLGNNLPEFGLPNGHCFGASHHTSFCNGTHKRNKFTKTVKNQLLCLKCFVADQQCCIFPPAFRCCAPEQWSKSIKNTEIF